MNGSKPLRAAFVSDLHLIEAVDPNAVLFVRLVDELAKHGFTHLFLLGDVFDIWVANHEYFRKRFAPILEKLRQASSAGLEIHYFEGNHDLDLDPYFARECGLKVHESAINIRLAGRNVRLEHGDQMDPEDRDYLFLRWLLRTRILRWLGRHLPGRIVSWIGETASRTSRGYTTRVRSGLSREAVEKKLVAHAMAIHRVDPFDLLIAGHVHVAFDGVLPDRNVRVINLGTWLDQPLIFELCDGVARVVSVAEFLRN